MQVQGKSVPVGRVRSHSPTFMQVQGKSRCKAQGARFKRERRVLPFFAGDLPLKYTYRLRLAE